MINASEHPNEKSNKLIGSNKNNFKKPPNAGYMFNYKIHVLPAIFIPLIIRWFHTENEVYNSKVVIRCHFMGVIFTIWHILHGRMNNFTGRITPENKFIRKIAV